MKKLFFAAWFLCYAAATSYAQTKTQETIGKNTLTGEDIVANKYEFKERISDYYLDTTTRCITLQLRGTSRDENFQSSSGEVILYDLENDRTKWSKKINFQTCNVLQSGSAIVFSSNRSYCLNEETGKKKWKADNRIFFIDPASNIGIGSTLNRNSRLQGIDLGNGEVLWKRDVSAEYGWNGMQFLNDSTVLLTAAGLQSLSLKDGSGWFRTSVTGKKDYTGTIAANAAGVALGLLTGTFVITTGYSLVRDLVSNVVIDSTRVYFADAQDLVCLNHDGGVEWTVPFPKQTLSKSTLYQRGDTLLMVNWGHAYMGARQLDYGTPFVSAYNTSTGERIFVWNLGEKKTRIERFIHDDRSISILVSDNRLVRYSLENGAMLSEWTFDAEQYGQLRDFVSEYAYLRTDGGFQPLQAGNPGKIYLAGRDNLLELDDALDTVREISFDDLFIHGMDTEKYTFLSQKGVTTVIDAAQQQVATFNMGSNAFRIGQKLYEVQGNTLVELDISEFY